MRTRNRALMTASGTILAIAAIYFSFRGDDGKRSVDSAPFASIRDPLPHPEGTILVVEPPTPALETEHVAKNVLDTRRMYAAHASLREPEVDDPDSETNLKNKQEMILKVLGTRSIPTPE